MIVTHPEIRKQIIDYDITFVGGIVTTLTIDPAAGDTISFDDDAVLVHLSAKPSVSDPKVLLPCEDITLFPVHILYINKRTREIVEASPEEKAEVARVWKALTESNGTIQ